MSKLPRIGSTSGGRTVVAVLAIAMAIVAAACATDTPTAQPRPSPTPGPPSSRVASTFTSQFDGQRWTFPVIVDPHDSATEVAYEYGAGSAFDHSFIMATGVLDAGQVSASTDAIRSDVTFCGRFVATNAFGRVSLDDRCHGQVLPPGAPSPEASPSATP